MPDVSKRGEWYTVKGVVNGRVVSADIPANQVEGKSRKDAEKVFERGLGNVERATRERD
jgi:hypothetical protein